MEEVVSTKSILIVWPGSSYETYIKELYPKASEHMLLAKTQTRDMLDQEGKKLLLTITKYRFGRLILTH